MNRERRVGRRSVVQSQMQKSSKPTPEYEDEQTFSKGPKKVLFNDDETFVMRRSTLKPLHEINNFQISPIKSKSHEKLYDETTTYAIPSFIDTFSKHNKIPLPPPSKSKFFETSIVKRHKEPSEPVLQSKNLFNSLIDSPCTKYAKIQYNNALSSASKLLINRHLKSVNENADIFKETTPEMNLASACEYTISDCETVDTQHSNDYNNITVQPKSFQTDCQIQTSDIPLFAENIEEQKHNQIEDVRQMKLKFSELIRTRFREFELEIEKHFSILENKITENYDKLLNKMQCDKTESPSLDTTIETIKGKNYTRMTGTSGILNNINQNCSFLKTPKTKGKTREEMLNQGVLTPCTMSFVLQEQLMNLNSSS